MGGESKVLFHSLFSLHELSLYAISLGWMGGVGRCLLLNKSWKALTYRIMSKFLGRASQDLHKLCLDSADPSPGISSLYILIARNTEHPGLFQFCLGAHVSLCLEYPSHYLPCLFLVSKISLDIIISKEGFSETTRKVRFHPLHLCSIPDTPLL